MTSDIVGPDRSVADQHPERVTKWRSGWEKLRQSKRPGAKALEVNRGHYLLLNDRSHSKAIHNDAPK